ncbi:MAG: carbonic anhydrase family protein [Ectothiorhodospiraceae bacterium]|nr:carbonic anhydrase family protein [Ectothiorhodospiraceae bacterium]
MKKIATAVALLAGVSIGSSVMAGGNHGTDWGYEGHSGPEHWSNLSKEFGTCDKGTRQSPINITGGYSSGLKPISFDYKSAKLDIVNNGHTIQVNRPEGSSITVDGERFELLQFHFHTPSENIVAGKPYDMEMHLVHKSEKGQLAVVGVFMKMGKENAVISEAWKHMPIKAGDTDTIASVSINAADLLPEGKAYARFNGSLTTPPCSEGVRWMVMKQPIELSSSQVKQFAKVVGENARPVQPLNSRFVLAE